jgi:hypothetical protein
LLKNSKEVRPSAQVISFKQPGMAKNRIIASEKKQKKQKSSNTASRFISSVLDGTILTKENVASLLPFFMYATLLAIMLIFNTYYAEKKSREIEQIRNEIVELRLRYIVTKSELMTLSNQSEVARRLENRGIVESTVPPRQLRTSERGRWFLSGLFSRDE